MTPSLLVVDDEVTLGRNIQTYFVRHGYRVTHATTGRDALQRLRQSPFDLVLLDLRLPDMDGVELLAEVGRLAPRAGVVMLTAHGSVSTAVEAMRGGALDYLEKPVALAVLKERLERLWERVGAAPELPSARGVDAILGNSGPVAELRQKIRALLDIERQSGIPVPAVLVIGETGTGKELVAQALHEDGVRAAGPFIELNCSALPAQLVEDELFGHERGAFTDAKERKLGLVEAADGGTLFLDEIGDLDLQVQAKLLKILEDRKLRRLGSVETREVDTRIVAATHRPLERMVVEGAFRADLFFRLRVIELAVPPLRERGDDVLLLARHFLGESCSRWRRSGLAFSAEAEAALVRHTWPGNVRELRNVVEQAVLTCGSPQIDAAALRLSRLPAAGLVGAERSAAASGDLSMEASERGLLNEALSRSKGNVTAAAKLLGITRDTLRYRMQKHGFGRRVSIDAE